MAHNPVVGTGKSIATALASAASTSFAIESQYVRLTPVTEGANVVVSQTVNKPSAAATDYYIPAGTSETLSMQRYSCKIIGITSTTAVGAASTYFTQLTCPEGQQVPFSIGNYVTLKNCNVAGFNTITHARVTNVNTSAGLDGSFQTKLTVDADTYSSGTFDEDTDVPGGKGFNDTTLYSSARVAARSDGGAGGLHIIQVQTTGEA
jgi:hypothetical protein